MPQGQNWLEAEEEAEGVRRELNAAARQEMGAWIAQMRPWDVFFTGTYARAARRDSLQVSVSGGRASLTRSDATRGVILSAARPNGFRRISKSKALRDGRSFLGFARRLRGRRIEGVIAAEPHQDGSYHLHGLLEAPGVSDAELEAFAFYWNGQHGFCRFDRPRGQEEVAAYTGKYVCKPTADVYLSRGLRRPQLRGSESEQS